MGPQRSSGIGPAGAALALVVSAAFLWLLSCAGEQTAAQGKAAQKKRAAVPVRVARAERQDVPFEIRAIGNVEAWSNVALKSRVAGQLLKVHIRDGEDVKEGQLLFEIDPLPFLEQVRAAEAALARDVAAEKQSQAAIARAQAQAENARAQADRHLALFREGVAAREQADQFRTAADAAEAQLNAERAALESARAAFHADEARLAEAKLHLSYTKIHAPISARAGFVGIKAGNLVKENDSIALVHLLQITPAYVSFSVPEQFLSEIRGYAASAGLPVEAIDEASGRKIGSGRLDVIDNSVDVATGTIRLKAEFPNSDRRLWPGQFVNVRLLLRTDAGILTVPNAAVQSGPEGRYVWLVTADQTAEMRRVEVPRTQGDLAVVASGLADGDTVITAGQLRVTKGAKIEFLKDAPAPVPSARSGPSQP